MSYEDALTQVVQNNGWNSLQEFEFHEMRTSVIHSLTKEAVILYAKSKWQEACEAQKLSIMDYYSYHFPIDSDAIARAPKPEFKP